MVVFICLKQMFLITLVVLRVVATSLSIGLAVFRQKSWFRMGESDINRTLYLGKIRGFWLPVKFEISAPLGKAVARLIDKNHKHQSK